MPIVVIVVGAGLLVTGICNLWIVRTKSYRALYIWPGWNDDAGWAKIVDRGVLLSTVMAGVGAVGFIGGVVWYLAS